MFFFQHFKNKSLTFYILNNIMQQRKKTPKGLESCFFSLIILNFKEKLASPAIITSLAPCSLESRPNTSSEKSLACSLCVFTPVSKTISPLRNGLKQNFLPELSSAVTNHNARLTSKKALLRPS